MKDGVTVCVPTIPGRDKLLQRALLSVQRQEIPPVDCFVKLDSERRGAAWARNQLLDWVQTEWLAWLDDDDELLPNHLKVLRRGARASRADLVYSYPEFVGGRDPLATSKNDKLVSPYGVRFGEEQAAHLRAWGNFIPVTYLVRTEIARRVGGMPEAGTFKTSTYAGVSGDCEDYGFLLRLLDAGAKFHHVPAVTWRYHFHESNLGGRSREREEAWRASTSKS
jgi:glycosyltransferase involved in cell wall biosynthesis